jgi:DHA2 family methylenomycin A resistance protein-like MFS transporter
MNQDQVALHRSYPIATVAVTSLGFLLVQLDGSIVNVALSQIGAALRTGISDLQWTVDVYFIAFAVLLLSAGALSDRWGARRAFVTGFAVFSVASLICGFAPNVGALIAARAVQGVGAALLVPCSLALLNGACSDNAGIRARAVGLWTAAGGVGIAMGPILGGLLIRAFGWRSIFLINMPIGLAGIWFTLRFLDQPVAPQKTRGFDPLGQALAALFVLGIVGAIIETGPSGWRSPLVLSSLVMAVTTGIGFIIAERKTPDPAVPIDLLRNMDISTTLLVGFAVNAVIFGVTFAFALYFQRVLFFSTVETGIAFLPFALMIIAANVVGGRFVARFGLRMPIFAGLLIAATGCALLAGQDASYLAILPGQLLIRLGIGIVVPAITTGILAAVPAARAGVASGALNATRQTGGAVGVAVFGALMATDIVRGVRTAMVIAGLSLLVTAVISLVGMRLPQSQPARTARPARVNESIPSSAR